MTKTSTLLAAMTLAFGAAAFPAHASHHAAMTSDQINAQHDAATKQCDAMKGDQKDVCNKRADADKDKAQAQAKADKEKAEANRDVSKAKRDGDYDVELKKCDAMSGDAESKCTADVKARFGK